MRSPKLKGKLPLLPSKIDSAGDSRSSGDQNKKPRTVHIDVYCTGTEIDSDASTSSSDTGNRTLSTPQTVFESRKVKVTHKRAHTTELPLNIQEVFKERLPRVLQGHPLQKLPSADRNHPSKDNESDVDDGASTAYPSQMSSFSALKDLGSSFSSVLPSWSTVSMSSYPPPDEYDSVANTSWKDTYSDIASLMQSRSSIAQTDSLDFVPRKFSERIKTASISETPEITDAKKNLLETPSLGSVQGSDSFEYANSEDRFRIKQMEHALKEDKSAPKFWKTPQLERKHMLQQKKLRQYFDNKANIEKFAPKIELRDSDSEDTDSSGKGWTFMKNDDKKLERDGTVRRTSKEELENKLPSKQKLNLEPEGLSGSSATNRSPSAIALHQRLSLDPNLRAPFTIKPGIYSNPRYIAKKFGTVVPVFRKPGHHVGPAKNPDCLCDHCQKYFDTADGYRTRTRSLGDGPMNSYYNWKEAYKQRNSISRDSDASPKTYTDF